MKLNVRKPKDKVKILILALFSVSALFSAVVALASINNVTTVVYDQNASEWNFSFDCNVGDNWQITGNFADNPIFTPSGGNCDGNTVYIGLNQFGVNNPPDGTFNIGDTAVLQLFAGNQDNNGGCYNLPEPCTPIQTINLTLPGAVAPGGTSHNLNPPAVKQIWGNAILQIGEHIALGLKPILFIFAGLMGLGILIHYVRRYLYNWNESFNEAWFEDFSNDWSDEGVRKGRRKHWQGFFRN